MAKHDAKPTNPHPDTENRRSSNDSDRWLRTQELADYLGVSTHTIRSWRNKKVGPRYSRTGNLCLYRLSDIQAWLTKHQIEPDTANLLAAE